MLRCTEHYLCLLSLAATKQRSPSQLGIMNTGPFMLRLATSIITSDVRMGTGLSLLVSYLYQKVSLSSFSFFSILEPSETCYLTFFHQLTRLKLGLLSSDSFAESYSMFPWHLCWNHLALVKRNLRFFDVLMHIFDV